MVQSVESLKDRAIESRDIGQVEAATLHRLGVKRPFALMAAAAEIREHFKGNKVNLCGIVNAKSGLCAENCKFCAQSAHHQTDAPVYPLLKKAEMVDRARRMKEESAHMFGIITSGTRIESEQEWEEIYGTVKDLKKAGLFRYHHNLETARSFFDRICTTHEYEEDIDTARAAKEAGLSTCSGGIIGMCRRR
jgi:biotin synthase